MTPDPLPAMTEAELQRCVIRAARLLGYRVAHFRPARTTRGDWRTPVEADGMGFPDLVLAGHGRVLFRELKGNRGTMRPEQARWLDVLRAAGADAGVWRPADWRDGTILSELREGTTP